MKIYGPFHMLNNPIVMTSLALDAVTAGASLYNAYEQSHTDDFLTASMLKGEPVTSLPGGPIRHLLSKLPGGVVSPDVQASPEQMLQEIGLLQQQRGEKLKEVGEYGKLRGEVGPAPFQAGGPFSSDLTRLTGSDTTFAEQTLPEKREEEAARQRDIANKRLSPEGRREGAAAAEAGRLSEINKPSNLMADLTRRRAEAEAGAEGRLAAEGSPAGLSLIARKADVAASAAAARTAAVDRQKQTDLENTPISDLRSNKTSGGVYVNKDTLKTATGASGEPKTKREADNNADYVFVPNKYVDGPGGLNDIVNTIKQFKELKKEITPDIFPDTTGSNSAATAVALTGKGSSNYLARHNNPKINRFYAAAILQAALIRRMQGRYNQREMNIPIMPDPGGLASVVGGGTPGLHILSKVPIKVADSYQVAQDKIDQVIQSTLGAFQSATGIGSLDPDTSELPDPGDVEPK